MSRSGHHHGMRLMALALFAAATAPAAAQTRGAAITAGYSMTTGCLSFEQLWVDGRSALTDSADTATFGNIAAGIHFVAPERTDTSPNR